MKQFGRLLHNRHLTTFGIQRLEKKIRQRDDCKMSGFAKSINHSITFHHFYDRIFGKKTLRSWRFWFGTKRNATCFSACYFVVASLNLDLSRGQILNDAKSIKNSKASTFLRAQIVAKKNSPFFPFSQSFDKKNLMRKLGFQFCHVYWTT